MSTASPTARLRVLTVLLSLALLFGGAAPRVTAVAAAPATAAEPAPTAQGPAPAGAVQQAPAGQADVGRELQAIQEAYELLLDRYALPLDPVELANAAQDGMTDALKDAGIDSPAAGLGNLGGDRAQEWTALRQRFQALAARYSDTLPPDELSEAAIHGMAVWVDDAHTNYLTPDDYQEHLRWTRGDVQYGGIGARMRGPQATVIEVFPDTPAERAGIRPGDVIVQVDDTPTTDMRLDEVVNIVRGEEGSSVRLGVQRAGTSQVDTLTVTRAQVSIPFVASHMLPNNIGYVALRGFPEPSVIDGVEKAVQQFQRDGVRGIVLDLRGNSGGRLDVGSRLLSRFIPDGPIYRAVDRRGREETINVREARPILTVPLAVLIDDGTASMGELFAVAIQEHHVGQILGVTSAGAVAASVVLPLSNGGALQLSVEQVYSGGGALLDRVGVHPDQEVELDLDALRSGHDSQLDAAATYLASAPAPAPPVAAGAR
ncbi:MAG TPA: S41 family peptidase [Chloroflexota bacterium]|jgi:carboxyl-terminal processing protease